MRWVVYVIILLASLTAGAGASGRQDAGGLAVALIIDSSGSMKANDPGGVRLAAANEVVKLLGERDQVTVIEFADQASVPVPLREAGGEAARSEIAARISAIGAKGDTDIKGGLEIAFQELAKGGENRKKLAIMLSDGEPDAPQLTADRRKMADYLAGVDKIAAAYKSNGWAVHCIALHKEKAGQLLSKIAQQTGGEYYFVKDAAELVNFYQSILLAQKYAGTAKPALVYEYDRSGPFKVGRSFPVRAYLQIEKDRLVPGPHLKIQKFDLIAGFAGREPLIIPMRDDGKAESADAKAGDGIFSAPVDCVAEGDATLTLAVQGTYRDTKIGERVDLGTVKIKPEFSTGQIIWQKAVTALPFLQDWRRAVAAAGATAAAIVLAVFLRRHIKEKAKEKAKGMLLYWIDGDGTNPAPRRLNISRTGKKEVLVASRGEADFVLPALDRDFAFKIEMIRDTYESAVNGGAAPEPETKKPGKGIGFQAAAMPGTYLVFGEIPRSRRQIFHGDRFMAGGYTFEFNYPPAGVRHKGEREAMKRFETFFRRMIPRKAPAGDEEARNKEEA
jgi:Mg-chelatase subunit ChlD